VIDSRGFDNLPACFPAPVDLRVRTVHGEGELAQGRRCSLGRRGGYRLDDVGRDIFDAAPLCYRELV
jgi:hypothetical protein